MLWGGVLTQNKNTHGDLQSLLMKSYGVVVVILTLGSNNAQAGFCRVTGLLETGSDKRPMHTGALTV